MNLNNYSVEEQEGPTKTYPLTGVSKKVALEYIKKKNLSDKNKSGYPISRKIKEKQAILAIIESSHVAKFYIFNFLEPGEFEKGSKIMLGNTLESYCNTFQSTQINIEAGKLERLEAEYNQNCKVYAAKTDFDGKEICPICNAIKGRFVKSLYNIFEQHNFLRVREDSKLLNDKWSSFDFSMTITQKENTHSVRKKYRNLFNPCSSIDIRLKVVINSIFGKYIDEVLEISDNEFAIIARESDRYYTRTLFLIELNN